MSTPFSIKKVCFYILTAGLLLVLAGVTPQPTMARVAPAGLGDATDGLAAQYKGLNKVHLRYDTSQCQLATDPSNYTWQLRATINGGSPVVLASGSSFTAAGKINHGGLSHGDIVVYELGYLANADPTHYFSVCTWNDYPLSQIASLTEGASLGGTLLFDETINGNEGFTNPSLNIFVPAGMSLAIGNLTDAAYIYLSIYGTLDITGPITVQGGLPEIDLYAPTEISNLASPVRLYFMPGSEGSTLSGDGTGSTVEVMADTSGGSPISISGPNWQGLFLWTANPNLEIHNATNFGLHFPTSYSLGGKLAISNSDGQLSGDLSLIGSGELDLTQTKLNPFASDISLLDQAVLNMDGVTLGGIPSTDYMWIYGGSSSASFQIKNSLILGAVSVIGSEGVGVFSGDEIYGDMQISPGENLTMSNNILTGQIKLYSSSATKLTIENNSFVGPEALAGFSAPEGSVTVGANYYGDRGGPSTDFNNAFLSGRGAYSDAPTAFGSWNTSGTFPDGTHAFPNIWLINYIIGQNTIPHGSNGLGSPMLQGRNTLVSLDIGVSAKTLSGLQVYALLDGQKIPANSFNELHRDSGDFSPNAIEQGQTTVNIILPPVTNSTATLEVYADTKGVVSGSNNGRPAGDLLLLFSTTLEFSQPQSLSFEVIPLDIGGLCTRRSATTQGTERVLTDDLPQRFPVPNYLITIVTRPSHYYFCTMEDMVDRFFAAKVLATIGLTSKLGYNPAQRTVVVAPSGSMGGNNGANAWYARKTIMVDESAPFAALHELGHTVGLYLDTEQYNLPAYLATGGIPVQGVTAFAPEGSISITSPNGTKNGRLIHFASSSAWWFNQFDKYPITDIMGENDFAWPIMSTLNALNFATAASPQQPVEQQVKAPSAGATHTVFLWGLMQSDGSGNYHVIPGSAQAFDLIGIPSFASWKVWLCNQTIPGGNSLYWEIRDSQGAQLNEIQIGASPADTSLAPVEAFCRWANFDPTQAARMTLGESPQDASLMDLTPGGSLPSLTTHPASGSTLGSQISLGWTGGAAKASAATNSTLYWAWFSPDGGATWQPAGLPVADPSLSFSTDFLPVSSNIAIQAFASDGFQQSVQEIDNLSMANRPPQVSVDAPFEGIAAPVGTAWDLVGHAYDLEDGVDITTTWTDSLDGALGSGTSLLGVTLSPGDHTLTFTATDKGGLSTSLQRHVTVGAVTQADLDLSQDSLSLRIAGSDPMISAPLSLMVGTNYTLKLQVQGTGVPLTTTLALYVTPPGGSETLLLRQDVSIDAFSTGSLVASLTPALVGDYHIRGAIEASSLTDPNAANNQFTWIYSASSNNPPASHQIYLPMIRR